MPEATYLCERKSEYWTSCQIEKFLLDAGYSVTAIPMSQAVEHDIPSDFIYVDRSRIKIFGLQYKALYHNSRDHWKLDEHQHNELQRFPWMYYCTSELKRIGDSAAALSFARFYPSGFPYQKRLNFRHAPFKPGYRRWPAFFQGFRACKIGHKITDMKAFMETLRQCRDLRRVDALIRQIVDVFLVDLDSKKVVIAQSSRFSQ
jgi:hypothetical protein